jgi:hypothetical protein
LNQPAAGRDNYGIDEKKLDSAKSTKEFGRRLRYYYDPSVYVGEFPNYPVTNTHQGMVQAEHLNDQACNVGLV